MSDPHSPPPCVCTFGLAIAVTYCFLQPYKTALAEVVKRFKLEVEEIERQKHDMQGDLMKRELAEREQALKNVAIIAKNNEELKKQRSVQLVEDLVSLMENRRAIYFSSWW